MILCLWLRLVGRGRWRRSGAEWALSRALSGALAIFGGPLSENGLRKRHILNGMP